MVWTAGALAICVASPTDLVKVRLQSEGKLPPGVPRRYSGAMNAYSTIVKQVWAPWTIALINLSFLIYTHDTELFLIDVTFNELWDGLVFLSSFHAN